MLFLTLCSSHAFGIFTKGLPCDAEALTVIFVIFTKFFVHAMRAAVFSEMDVFLQILLHPF